MENITKHLKNKYNILIASHLNPDGDAIGSLIAMGLSIAQWNKRITLYNESPIPAVYRFLPSVNRIVNHIPISHMYDLAIILDCGELNRIGRAFSYIREIPLIINIDHHRTNTYFGDYQLIDTSACATCEIIYRIIKELSAPMSVDVATAIYTGILTDTGSFRFSNTNRQAFEICETMVSLGVDPYYIAKNVYGHYSLERLKLLNRALDSIELSKNGKLSMMTLTQSMLQETGTKAEDADGIINYARWIEDVQVAVLIFEDQNGQTTTSHFHPYHVSLRSNGTVDVSAIAASFGGGGHYNAAGFSIESTLSALKTQLFNLADKL